MLRWTESHSRFDLTALMVSSDPLSVDIYVREGRLVRICVHRLHRILTGVLHDETSW